MKNTYNIAQPEVASALRLSASSQRRNSQALSKAATGTPCKGDRTPSVSFLPCVSIGQKFSVASENGERQKKRKENLSRWIVCTRARQINGHRISPAPSMFMSRPVYLAPTTGKTTRLPAAARQPLLACPEHRSRLWI